MLEDVRQVTLYLGGLSAEVDLRGLNKVMGTFGREAIHT